MTRSEVLSKADSYVNGDREQDYGSPESNFQTIADLWAVYLQGCGVAIDFLEAHDVAAMLALLKIARIASGHAKADNWIDLAGYAACGGEIQSAAVEDLRQNGFCGSCSGCNAPHDPNNITWCYSWEWRGPQDEKGE